MSSSLLPSLDEQSKSSTSLSNGEFTSMSSTAASFSRIIMSSSIRRSLGEADLSSAYESQISKSSRLRDNIHIQELTINKLQYDAVGLVGRETEVNTLRSCLDNLLIQEDHKNNNQNKKQVVFLKGYSGTGKTKLVNTALQKTTSMTENGMFVVGKFDFQSCDEPYSGIAAAFNEICRSMKNHSIEKKKRSSSLKEEAGGDDSSENDDDDDDDGDDGIGHAIASGLGSEISLLLRLIPDLDGLLPDSYQKTKAEPAGYNLDAGKMQFEYVFRVLTRVLTSFASPMVLVLDDLQWADVSSLEILDLLISDTENTNKLMIVGCYRSNEVNENHILYSVIEEISKKPEKQQFQLTQMEIESLNEDQSNKVIMAMLSIDNEERTKGLSEICFKRTNGNPFFLIEFITMLEEEDLISYNLGTLEWKWDKTVIEDRTMSTANVVDLLQARMRKLPDNVLLVMQYAACLGSSSVTLSIIDLLWTEHAVKILGKEKEDITKIFGRLEEANFLEFYGIDAYRFAHDKVKEAALSLGNVSSGSFQSEIGRILFLKLDKAMLEKVLFDVTDLMNKGEVYDTGELVELNIWAAEKAKHISAFNSALKYATKAMELLPERKWSTHRDVALRLYTMAAQLAFALRRTEETNRFIEQVLSQSSITTLEKAPTYITKIAKLTTSDMKPEDAVQTCLVALHDLGLSPGSMWTLPVRALASIFSTIKKTKKMPKEKFRNLSPLRNAKDEAIMTILFRLSYSAYMVKRHVMVMWATNEMVEITLARGVSKTSCLAFSTLGMLAGMAMKDYEAATYFSEVGLLLLKTEPSKYSESSTLASVCQFVLPYTYPLHSCAESILRSYKLGLQSGNFIATSWALQLHSILYPYVMGKRLGDILGRIRQNVSQMEDFKQPEQALLTRIFWQLMLNLAGQSNNPKKLKGTIFDAETFVPERPAQRGFIELAKLELFVFLGDYEQAAELALDAGGVAKGAPGHFLGMIEIFHRGVALYAMARKTKKRKFIKAADNIKSTVDKWAEQKNPNTQHYIMLLNAEQASLQKTKHTQADDQYRKAIALAARTGHIHQAALFNERYADFLFHRKTKTEHEYEAFQDLAEHHANEAIRLYRNWGAFAKVHMLEKERT
ncbi:unnamed protein product [Cylindrotheca closterium]|uniref:Orc1-like AAA ATPase domain-containing protein n=1 Tax=Cylindrotheca closterium TaxID=2856 RepID=A0AAD2FJ41_9STRA|nr:unnamed protein product [Cylindrotheca closterium]